MADGPFFTEHGGHKFPVTPEFSGAQPYSAPPSPPTPSPPTPHGEVPQTANWVEQQPPQMRHIEQIDPNSLSNADLNALGYKRQAARKAGDVKTTSSEAVSGAIPDDPGYQAYRAASAAQHMGIADTEARVQIEQAAQREQQLAQQAALEYAEMQQRAYDASVAEASARQAMSDVDASIAQQKADWVKGGSPRELFDGGAGTGMMLASIGIGLAGLGGPGIQSNAINLMNSTLDRSMRAQEAQTNSLFKQLENKYGDRDQARAALKMMQLQYAQTMAEKFAAQNAQPAVAVNLAKLQQGIQDQYMKAEDEFRARAYGNRQQQQNYRYDAGQSGGIVPLSGADRKAMLDYQLQQVKLAQAQTKLAQSNADLLRQQTGREPPEQWNKERPQITKLAETDEAIASLNHAIATSGGQFDPQGNYVRGSLAESPAHGLGLAPKLIPDVLRPEESVRATRALRQAAVQMAIAERGGRASDKAVQQYADTILGGWTESDAISGLEVALEQLQTGRASRAGAISPDALRYYETVTRPQGQARAAQANPGALGGQKARY